MIDEELFAAWGRFGEASRNGTREEAMRERERLLDTISSRAARPSGPKRFGGWLNKPEPVSLTRVDYRLYDSPLILHMIDDAEFRLRTADTEDDQCAAEFALQELRAVLQERG